MQGPCTVTELMDRLGVSRGLANSGLNYLRLKCYVIENRGSRPLQYGGGKAGTLHLTQDPKRHPWLHLGVMDFRGAALDEGGLAPNL